MNNKERAESLFNEYQEKYDIDFKDEFYVKELIKLKLQYQETPDEHIRTKTDLMNLILRMEQQLELKEKIHTIPLIDEFDNWGKEITINNYNSLILEMNMTDILSFKLEQGREQNKLVDVTGFRRVGKTTELIKFAKNNDYAVILPNRGLVGDCVREYEYLSIFSDSDLRLRNIKTRNCVVDENVNISRIKNEFGLNIITGYINKKNK